MRTDIIAACYRADESLMYLRKHDISQRPLKHFISFINDLVYKEDLNNPVNWVSTEVFVDMYTSLIKQIYNILEEKVLAKKTKY